MRLTDKNVRMVYAKTITTTDSKGNIFTKADISQNSEQILKCKRYNKLADIEDIEEEYCVDLIHFFKAIDGIYVKHNNNIIFISCPDLIFAKTLEVPRTPIAVLEYFINDKKCFKCPCEYGKTWALTKEELENE